LGRRPPAPGACRPPIGYSSPRTIFPEVRLDPISAAGRGLLDWLRGGKSAPEPAREAEPAQVGHEEPQAELLRRFEDEGEIGRGGMSSVRRVHDKNLLRKVAMKVLDPDLAREPRIVQAFLEEAQITAQLDHPNLIPIHDLGVDEDGTHYFTMRLVRGHTLSDWIDSREDLGSPESLQEGLGILIKVCDALAFAHSRSVLHCDLKPANIMVGAYGEVYLMDWGLAQLRGAGVEVQRGEGTPRLAREGKASGTPGYMSPEQAHGKWSECDARTDVFSLGAVLYHLVTGRAPFSGESVGAALRHAQQNEFDPPQLASAHVVPPELSRIVEKALRGAPEERYQSAVDLKRDLERFLRGGLHFPLKTFAAGTQILVEGEIGDTAYQIVSGSCRVLKNIDGAAREIAALGPGTVFGEAGLVSARPRTATVEAVDDVTAMVVTREVLQQSLGQGSWLGAIVLALAERFRNVDEQLTQLQEEKARGEYWRLVPP
jgi:eukaryotic-like serine/threonine-protein kinase